MAHYYTFKVVDLLDTPVFDCTVTQVPASSSLTLTVVSSLIEQCQRVTCFDATGAYIGLYQGASGSEELICQIGGGFVFDQDVVINKGNRISVRSMQDAVIALGSFTVQFKAIVD